MGYRPINHFAHLAGLLIAIASVMEKMGEPGTNHLTDKDHTEDE